MFDFPSSLLNIILSYFSNVSFLTPVVTKINFTVCSAMRAMAYASRYVESSVLNIILNFLKVSLSKLVIVMTINLTVSASTRAMAGTSRDVDSSFLNVVLNCFFFSLSLVVERKTAFPKLDFEPSFLDISFSSLFNLFFKRAPNKKFDKLFDLFFCIVDKKHDSVSYFFQSSIFQISR